VTIGIGFHCPFAVVLAADEQHTVQGYYKTHSLKIGNLALGDATIFWTFAGLPNLTTVMRDGLVSRLPASDPSAAQVEEAISLQIKEMKTNYPEEMKTQEFLYAISCGDDVRFVRVSGGIVDKPDWAVIGIGDSSLVNYVFKTFQLGPLQITNASDAIFLATYMVYLAKQFVDGVGGPTDVVAVRKNGRFDVLWPGLVERLEANMDMMQSIFKDLYNILTNKAIEEDRQKQMVKSLTDSIKNFRKAMS
jgi:hypothetical protein